MANTIARCRGIDSSRVKECHRLGSTRSEAEVATWRTHIRISVVKDGSGEIVVERDGKMLLQWKCMPEMESKI